VVVMHEGCGLHGGPDELGGFEDLDATLREGIARLRTSRELAARDHIRGFVFDPETGALREAEATAPRGHG
jgi:carbonic anhydrase